MVDRIKLQYDPADTCVCTGFDSQWLIGCFDPPEESFAILGEKRWRRVSGCHRRPLTMDHADAEFDQIARILVDDAQLKEMLCHGSWLATV
jgi:hypothetical protein